MARTALRVASWTTLAVLFGVGVAGAAQAGTFIASASISGSSPIPNFYAFSLPQYSGPGTVTSVVLSMTGVASGLNFYFFDPTEGLTVPSSPVSWNEQLYGPAQVPGEPGPVVATAVVSTEFIGGTIPPCVSPTCGKGVAVFGTPSASFSTGVSLSDLADFKGSGSNSLGVLDPGRFEQNLVSATVTETITTTAVPEPGAWVLMTLGVGLIGGAMRSRYLWAPPVAGA